MEPTDDPPEEEEGREDETSSRPWGPGSPAPGAPVMSVDEGGPHERPLNGARATALYESARFPDPGVAPEAQTPEGDDDATLRILGVPAPPEIAGPVLAALGLLLAVLGWRWRRRRRRR